MKSEIGVASVAKPAPKIREEEKANFAQTSPKPIPAAVKQSGEIPLQIRASDDNKFQTYRHWGINE